MAVTTEKIFGSTTRPMAALRGLTCARLKPSPLRESQTSRARTASTLICRRANTFSSTASWNMTISPATPIPPKTVSLIAFLDAQTLETKFEVMLVGNADIASSGKDGHYVFVTMYNTENAVSSEGMIERD